MHQVKKIKIYFSNAFFESDDTGDITTANSYGDFDYKNDIQFINDFRNTDLLDIRPRVSDYIVAESNRSPLEFFGRQLNASGNYIYYEKAAGALVVPANNSTQAAGFT